MKLLINTTDYDTTIQIALNMNQEYNESCIFHCYWNGILNEKHLYSILSCYYFNVYKNKHKIILWLENNIENEFNIQIEKYAEIKYILLQTEIYNTIFLQNIVLNYNKKSLEFYSDFIRLLLLYNYGGIWFDLDCLFLKNFDPLFYNFKNEICIYQWGTEPYPNNAIIISLEKKSEKMKQNIKFIIYRDRGWRFQGVSFDLPLDLLVLPCSWFDGGWINNNPYNVFICDGINENESIFAYTNIKYTFDNFFKGAFCYHWHNRWNFNIDNNSIIMQLIKIIEKDLQKNLL